MTRFGSLFKPLSDKARFKKHKTDHTTYSYREYMKWGEISVPYMILHKTVSIVAYAIGRLKTVSKV